MKINDLFSILILIFLVISGTSFTNSSITWQRLPLDIGASDINTLMILPGNQSRVFIGGAQGIYLNTEEPQSNSSLFNLGSKVNVLYDMTTESNQPNLPASSVAQILAATDAGLFLSDDEGRNWERIFDPSDPQERKCLSVIKNGNEIYLGTNHGLFHKALPEPYWRESDTVFQRRTISALAADQQYLYVAADREVYRKDKISGDLREIFSLPNKESENAASEVLPDEFNPEVFIAIKQIKTNRDATILYLATTEGIFSSSHQGLNWERVNTIGLPVKEMTSLFVSSQGDLWAGTRQGVFYYQNEIWNAVYQGMETRSVHFIEGDEQKIYAATDQGLFVMNIANVFPHDLCTEQNLQWRDDIQNRSKSYQELEKDFQHEPSVNQVQQMAVRYADVDPEKIRHWKSAAQKKAILPTLSVGLDRSATELFHWDTGANPDALTKGKDFMDWDVSVSWNLGDLIWNDDQTSIDSRSKLMVELRDDILDQVTRLYFERRRIQIELRTLNLDPATKIAKEMRVAELTALVDSLTGEEFSRNMIKNN